MLRCAVFFVSEFCFTFHLWRPTLVRKISASHRKENRNISYVHCEYAIWCKMEFFFLFSWIIIVYFVSLRFYSCEPMRTDWPIIMDLTDLCVRDELFWVKLIYFFDVSFSFWFLLTYEMDFQWLSMTFHGSIFYFLILWKFD